MKDSSGQFKLTTAEILVVGNELLNGTTLDTNSYWLSKRLTKIGVRVERKTTVRDVLPVISKAFRDCAGRKPSWIISVGGLGPTFDDMTIQGLALAIRRELVLDRVALGMLKSSYQRRAKLFRREFRRLPKTSLKMARIPRDSTPLQNPVGSAPAVLAKAGRTRIVSLPGVPSEMKAIFEQQIAPLVKEDRSFVSVEEWVKVVGISESKFAPRLNRIEQRFSPSIYIKSHPRGFERGKSILNIQVILTAGVGEEKALLDKLTIARNEIMKEARKLGASVQHMKSVR
jgi:nicotinamide-nucleotide amidase